MPLLRSRWRNRSTAALCCSQQRFLCAEKGPRAPPPALPRHGRPYRLRPLQATAPPPFHAAPRFVPGAEAAVPGAEVAVPGAEVPIESDGAEVAPLVNSARGCTRWRNARAVIDDGTGRKDHCVTEKNYVITALTDSSTRGRWNGRDLTAGGREHPKGTGCVPCEHSVPGWGEESSPHGSERAAHGVGGTAELKMFNRRLELPHAPHRQRRERDTA
ncbi:unnamed protein product [Lampetra fluviatilis]